MQHLHGYACQVAHFEHVHFKINQYSCLDVIMLYIAPWHCL